MTGTHDNSRVIAVANLKGGVGKTTTVLNLAGFAGRMGKRILAVDTDPQGSLTRVALPDNVQHGSLTDAFRRRATSLNGIRCPSRFIGVDLVPSTLALEAVIQSAIPWEGREYVLLDMLAPHCDEYDLILIDCRPGIDLSVTNALTAARWLLVPVECSFMALDGVEHVHALQRRLNQRINPGLRCLVCCRHAIGEVQHMPRKHWRKLSSRGLHCTLHCTLLRFGSPLPLPMRQHTG